MSKKKHDHRTSDAPTRPGEGLRERVVQIFTRGRQLDPIAEEVLRGVVAQCSVRDESAGRIWLQVPGKIAQDQQMKVARPLRRFTRQERERVIRQLEGIEKFGWSMARLVRVSLLGSLGAMGGDSAFDDYLTVCRDSGVDERIVRTLQHLRDAISVKFETYFTDPTKRNVSWSVHVDRITAAMLKRVEESLREVDSRALHAPACDIWLKSLQAVFDQVKAGTFQLPARPGSARPESTPDSQPATGEAGSSAPPSEALDDVQEEARRFRSAFEALREALSPQYLDLAPEDFAALCRLDKEAGDSAQGLGWAIERFSIDCLGAVRQRFLESCAARARESEAFPEDFGVEIGNCVRQLTEEAASFRGWLEEELPQRRDALGRRLFALAERSLLSGLFFLFLQRRFAEVFCDPGEVDRDGRHGRAEAKSLEPRRAEPESLATRRAAIEGMEASLKRERLAIPAAVEGETHAIALDVIKCCEAALAALLPLLVLDARLQTREAEGTARSIGKVAQRLLSAEAARFDAGEGPPDYIQLVQYEPGDFPSLRCRCLQPAEQDGAATDAAEVCRFSRRGGVALFAGMAIPISVLFGEKSGLARTAAFLGGEANRHLAHWRRLAGSTGVRQCLPYLENLGAQAARIQVPDRESGGLVTLLALPAAAMAMSKDFADNFAMPQALEQARRESPAKEALLRAVEAHWRRSGIAPGDYSLCVLDRHAAAEEKNEPEANDQRQRRQTVRRFLNQKARWPLEEAEQLLKVLGIVIEPKEDGAPHGRIRHDQRWHTLSSKLLKDRQVYATYLHEWIRAMGQEPLLADLLQQKDPRLAPYMRKPDAGQQ